MAVDFALLGSILEKVIVAGVGAVAARVFERRTRLIVFYGHVGYFRLNPQEAGGQPGTVHTHSVVIRNAGRLPAHNVRVPHRLSTKSGGLHLSVYPEMVFQTQDFASGADELVFAVLPPKHMVTISYLYFPPLQFSQINLPVYSDEGQAKVLDVLPTPRLPAWQRVVLLALIFIGAGSILYFGAELTLHLLNSRA